MAFVPIAENKRVENRRVVSRMERKKRNRIAALLLAVTILVIMLYSAFFVAAKAFHLLYASQPLLLRLHIFCAGVFLSARTMHKEIP